MISWYRWRNPIEDRNLRDKWGRIERERWLAKSNIQDVLEGPMVDKLVDVFKQIDEIKNDRRER
jgi:hypothetical protein